MQAAVESSHRDSMSVSNNKSAANKPHLSKGMMNIGGIKMRTGLVIVIIVLIIIVKGDIALY